MNGEGIRTTQLAIVLFSSWVLSWYCNFNCTYHNLCYKFTTSESLELAADGCVWESSLQLLPTANACNNISQLDCVLYRKIPRNITEPRSFSFLWYGLGVPCDHTGCPMQYSCGVLAITTGKFQSGHAACQLHFKIVTTHADNAAIRSLSWDYYGYTSFNSGMFIHDWSFTVCSWLVIHRGSGMLFIL